VAEISEYLTRASRAPVRVAYDLCSPKMPDIREMSQICDELNVMFSVSSSRIGFAPIYLHCSEASERVTGYRPDELVGCRISKLQCPKTDQDAARTFMSTLLTSGLGEAKLVKRDKAGELYGCHFLAVPAIQTQLGGELNFFGFATRCPLDACSSKDHS